MIPALLLNSGINLAVGIGLLLVWRVDRAQPFSRWLGWSFIAQVFVAPAYVVLSGGAAPWSGLALGVLVVTAAASLMLWIVGVSHLAGLPLSGRQTWTGAILLLAFGGTVVVMNPRAGQAVSATLTALTGAVALVWLRKSGIAERIAGATMLLLGLNQFVFVAHGEAGLQWQASVASTLRVVLGLALFYAAAQRSRSAAGQARHQLVAMIERSHQGVAVMQGEEMKYANPALLQIYGLPPDGSARISTGQKWRDATMPEDEREIARERHRKLISGELAEDHWEGERRSFDGRRLHLRFSSWRVDWDGVPAEQIVVTDDTARHDAAQTLLHQATHDELTGLPNRSALLQRLRELCEREPVQPFALLLLDIDRFKLFNDAHGPSVGDEVLRALADALHATLKNRAAVMRLGEDEFALLAATDASAPNDAERTARALAQQVQTLLMQPLATARHQFFLDVSMGVALHPANGRGPESLLRAANAAMHEAKRTPGTSLQFAEERFARGSGATLESEQALRAGIKSDEFMLVYQPKVDAASGAPVGFEALVRWDRPGAGRVGPAEFIPAAERTGLIGPLGNLILTLACQQIAEWREAFGRVVPVAVNVSPLQLLDPGFPELVLRTLRHYDIPPHALSLEITEGAAVAHMDEARERIGRMRQHGIEVALDDFGTGFSSLNMLRSLPLTAVKIDRSLIDPMPAPDATAVVKAICDLAAVLRLEVVAEGVETPEHASAALAAGCQVLQGFLYARPLEPREAAQWLGERAATAAAALAEAGGPARKS